MVFIPLYERILEKFLYLDKVRKAVKQGIPFGEWRKKSKIMQRLKNNETNIMVP
jgi:hypothetical protein